MRRLAPLLLGLGAVCAWPAAAGAAAPAPSPIKHVYTIVLENESASVTFGPNSPAPYLANTLRSEGAYLPNYHGIGHNSLDNYIAMISGQAPNPTTQADCGTFSNFLPGTIGANGQAEGTGCVYPSTVPTIVDQLGASGKTWRDYNEDMGADPSREAAQCGHPAVGAQDKTEAATPTDQYATRHDPFVYFHSIIDDPALCDTHVVNLDQLPADLASAASTPNYVFITPDLCEDGHDAPCANGDVGGLAQVNQFLQKWVPMITSSPAFKDQGGLLMITFDEAAASDSSSCCGEIPGLSSPMPGVSGPGGGDTGAVLLSPCIAPGTVSQTPYNHYTMLRSVEDIFGLPHLGYAGLSGEVPFGSDIFTRNCSATPQVKIKAPKLASKSGTSPKVKVSWSGSDGSGPGIQSYSVQVAPAGKSNFKTLQAATTGKSLAFNGKAGKSYTFRVQATDLGGAQSAFATATTVIPSGTKPRGGHYHGHWKVGKVTGAWEGKAISCSSKDCTFTLAYKGGSIEIIGERGPNGGSASVTLDHKTLTIKLHSGKRRTRQAVFRGRAKTGRHHLTIQVKRGTVALEGFAVTS